MSVSPEERLKRARSVRLHVIAALLVLLVLIAVSALTDQNPWWLWVLMAWMPLVAAHTGWAMGLFDRKGS